MWVLRQYVSIKKNETIQHVQYFGDDGEVGEVGEYFGEAGVINAGAICRRTGQSHYFNIILILTCCKLKRRERDGHY
jgi:hypothetical protein